MSYKTDHAVKLIQVLMATTTGLTVAQIVKRTGMSAGAVVRWTNKMHAAGLIYIPRYVNPARKSWARTWAWGNEPDADKPMRVPAAVYNMRKREKRAAVKAPDWLDRFVSNTNAGRNAMLREQRRGS